MKYYDELLDLECFKLEDVADIVGNLNSAKFVVRRLRENNLIGRVRKNLYVTISPVDYEPTVNKYCIGSHITDSAVISHHAALEYYGYGSQVYHTVNVSSYTNFQTFEFRGITYERTLLKFEEGVIHTPNQIKITDIERTMVDCLHSISLAGGIEEIIRYFRLVIRVKEEKLLRYLDLYKTNATYQRAGFILEMFKDDLHLSDNFFNEIEHKIKGPIRYLNCHQSQDCSYYKRWRLLVPNSILTTLYKGATENGVKCKKIK